jgi:hypothetical protein
MVKATKQKTERNDMPRETDIAKLEARIVELENALKALIAVKEPVDLKASEIKAYLKVREALACDKKCSPQFYGRIDVFAKCSCIPSVCGWSACGIGDAGGGGHGRFTDLGS